MMKSSKQKSVFAFVILFGCAAVGLGIPTSMAANISEFVTITPFIEIEGGYDDNIFEVAEDAPLPTNGESRDDTYVAAKAGVGVDIALHRQMLKLDFGVDYEFTYKMYSNNTDLEDTESYLNFDLALASAYEDDLLLGDRVRIILKDELAFIPIDEEEALLLGNRTLKNDFLIGAKYKVLATPRMALGLGYSYGRVDYQDSEVTVVSVADQYQDSADLTQESQTHTGTADFKYLINSRMTYLLTYDYDYTVRAEEAGELMSANFSRQNVLTGVQTKLSPRINTEIQGGYSRTSYDDVAGASQDDQDNFVASAVVNANFGNRPLMSVGYRRYFAENDFGDTLLTDDLFARLGFKVVDGLLVNLSGDYIMEGRDLYGDDSTQTAFGIDTEYEVLKNMKLLAGYMYRDKSFFDYNFLAKEDRSETTHTFSSGIEYKMARYLLLKGMYYYTDKTSNVALEEYAQNRFIASGRVLF